MEIKLLEFWRAHRKAMAVHCALIAVCAGLLARLIWYSERSAEIEKARAAELLDERIEETVTLVKREKLTLEQSRRVADGIRSTIADTIVAPDNAMAWASRVMNRYALQAGVEIRDLIELTAPRAPWQDDPRSRHVLDPVRFRIDTTATFEAFSSLLDALEADNPYACVVSLTVFEPREDEAPRRRITAVVEWPAWTARSAHVRQLLTTIH